MSLIGDGIYYVAIAWQVYDLSNAPTALSLVGVAWSVPMVLLLLGGGVVSDRFDRRHISFMYATWTLSIVALVGYGLATELWQAMAVSFVGGTGFAAGIIVWSTLVHRLVPTGLLGRVSSLDWLVSVSLIPLSFALTGPVADAIGAQTTLVLAGAIGAPVTLLFLFLPGMRDTERDGRLAISTANHSH